jgi:hypothetical protein
MAEILREAQVRALRRTALRLNFSFAIGLLMSLMVFCLPESALAARHWFTDENRYLVKTDTFEASVTKNSFCDPATRDTDVIVSLQFRLDVNFEVSNSPAYLKIVQSEIAPAVRNVCGEVTDLVVLNFFSRPLRNSQGEEIPASRAIFRNLLVSAYPASVKWVWFDAIFAGEFPPANADSFGDTRLTTERAIRSWLSKSPPDQLVAEFKNRQAAEARRQEQVRALEGELKAVDRELLELGTEAFNSQLSEESYRAGIDVFADACKARNLDGCLRLDRALAALEANCRGESGDREVKPWACGLFGYALEKAPILDFQNFYRNIPRTRDLNLINSLYKQACAAGSSFFCNRH